MSDGFNARRARQVLYVLGGLWVALGFALETVPVLVDATPELSGRVCAGLGAVILIAGRFGSDRLMQRCENVMARWH